LQDLGRRRRSRRNRRSRCVSLAAAIPEAHFHPHRVIAVFAGLGEESHRVRALDLGRFARTLVIGRLVFPLHADRLIRVGIADRVARGSGAEESRGRKAQQRDGESQFEALSRA